MKVVDLGRLDLRERRIAVRGLVVAALAAVVAAGAFGESARAMSRQAMSPYEWTSIYWGRGTLGAGIGESAGYDSTHNCGVYTSGSAAGWDGGSTHYMTVAIIDANGHWRYSSRSNSGSVAVYINPDTDANAMSYNKQAYAINSGSVSDTNTLLTWWYWTGNICA